MGVRATLGGTGKRSGHRMPSRAQGPELIVNGNFSDGTTGWTLGTNWTITGNQLVATDAAMDSFTQSGNVVTAGRLYLVTLTCTSVTSGGWKLLLEGGVNVFGDQTTAGTFQSTVLASTTGSIYVWANSLLTATFDNISVREIW